jgi:hypothetical protein
LDPTLFFQRRNFQQQTQNLTNLFLGNLKLNSESGERDPTLFSPCDFFQQPPPELGTIIISQFSVSYPFSLGSAQDALPSLDAYYYSILSLLLLFF